MLQQIGSLPFDFTMGSCAVDDNELFLCFDSQTPYACYTTKDVDFPSTGWNKLADSIYNHRRTKIAVNPSNFQSVSCSDFFYMFFSFCFKIEIAIFIQPHFWLLGANCQPIHTQNCTIGQH